MHLIEILLPLNDNEGRRFASDKFSGVRDSLTERFGGLTAFTRAPAQGTTRDGGKTVRDEIVVFEVMTEVLDHAWWRSYRQQLERSFQQDEIIIRASAVNLL
jgi:hypothetical protein